MSTTVSEEVAIRVVSSRGDLKEFIRFPYRIYRGNGCWIPPLMLDEWNTLSSERNPAFRHCEARYFLAEKRGRTVGRVAAIINRKYIERWKNPYCRFGWLDFVDDRGVAAALMSAVEGWAREKGLAAVHGPLGFTDLDREGMLIEGFDELGTMATNYNHPYYPVHLEALGYGKDVDWVEFELKAPKEIPEKAVRVQELLLQRNKLRLVPPRKKVLHGYARRIFELVNVSFADLYGVVELSDEQIDNYVKQYFGFVNPDYCKVVVDEKDEVIAFGLAIPSLSRALQKAQGRLLPFGFIHLLLALKYSRTVDFLLVAVRPDYQSRGVTALLMTEITRNAIRNGVVSAETNVELETNTAVQAMWKSYETRQHKRRRCYIKKLA